MLQNFLFDVIRGQFVYLCESLKFVLDACLELCGHPPIIVVGCRVHKVALKLKFSGWVIDTVQTLERFEGLFEIVESECDLIAAAHQYFP